MANRLTEIDVEIGKRLRNLRTARGMSQTVLAEGLNITFQQVQKYEYGRNRLSCATMLQACRVLGCQPVDIIGELQTDEA